MTPEHDHAVAERLHALSLRTDGGYTSAEIHAVLRDWARQNPPRRFALYQVIEDEVGFDGSVFAWGLAHPHYLTVRSDDERFHGRFGSTQSLLDALSHYPAEIGIVWLDGAPEDTLRVG